MNLLILILSISHLGINLISTVNGKDPIVTVPELGSFKGKLGKTIGTNQTIYEFLGIPYAESPSGKLRYKAPIPKAPWNMLKDFQQFSRGCPEITRLKKLSENELKEDIEDCLSLNVYTKNLNNNNTKQAVMFYVHGGAFSNGTAREFGGNHLLRNDIVLVTVQYRLGVLGFTSTQTKEIPGNIAILDILLALEWVQDNINYFGGDNTKVTIVGQSAGSSLTSVLTISPYVRKRLFHRLIIQSGSILAPWAVDYDHMEKSKGVCCKICKDCKTTEAINECLMKASVQDLVKAGTKYFYTLTLNDLHGILPKKPKELIQNIQENNIQIMGGVTKHDGSYTLSVFYNQFYKELGDFSLMGPREIVRKLLKFPLMGEEDNHGAFYNLVLKSLFTTEELKLQNSKSLIPKFIDITTVLTFESPVLYFVEILSKGENSKNYLYKFDYEGQYTRFGYEYGNLHYPFNGGSHHSDDNIYLYPYPYNNLNEDDLKMSIKMCNIFTSFVINGHPSADLSGTDLQPIISGTSGPFFHIDKEVTIGDDYLDDLFVSQTDPNSNKIIR